MILEVVKYGHPVLRKKGARLEKITAETKQLIADMFETMESRHGIGLAAQQVGHALQLTVIDIRPVEDRPSTLQLDGQPADPKSIMPLVLVNPEAKAVADPVAGPEGCLSFPEIYSEIARPEAVDYSREQFPGAWDGLDGILVLPWNERYTDEHVDYIADAVHECVAEIMGGKR